MTTKVVSHKGEGDDGRGRIFLSKAERKTQMDERMDTTLGLSVKDLRLQSAYGEVGLALKVRRERNSHLFWLNWAQNLLLTTLDLG